MKILHFLMGVGLAIKMIEGLYYTVIKKDYAKANNSLLWAILMLGVGNL